MSRINIYSEELKGQGANVVTKTSKEGTIFYGARLWIASPQALIDHSTPEDNDLNAVTLWFHSLRELEDYVERVFGELRGGIPIAA